MNFSVLNLDGFKQLAKTEFGLDFSQKNETLLRDSIHKRLHSNGLPQSSSGYQQYYQQLLKKNDELQALASLLTNNETYFFREPKQFQFLTDTLIPEMLARQTIKQPIRILSIGCSTGAEPYSIAMTLQQKYASASAHMFSIFAGDIDQNVLKLARTARYRSMEFRAISADLQHRFFVQEKTGEYTLSDEIRKMVSFHYMNVVADDVSHKLHDMDIIFFRNVSIYFDSVTRLAVQKNIIKLLKSDGYLIVGMTESMSNDFGLLNLKNQGSVFYFVKGEPVAERAWSKTEQAAWENQNAIKSSVTNHKAELINRQRLFQHTSQIIENKSKRSDDEPPLTKQEYYRAIELLNGLSADSDSTVKHFLLQAFILFNRQDFEHARDYVLRALDMAPFSIDGFLLLGMISKWQGHADDGIDWFKKALYIHADCWPAHYYLAGLYRHKKLWAKAAQEYRIVLQQLNQSQENYTQRLIIPLSFHRADIQLLCHSHLQQIVSRSNTTTTSSGNPHGD